MRVSQEQGARATSKRCSVPSLKLPLCCMCAGKRWMLYLSMADARTRILGRCCCRVEHLYFRNIFHCRLGRLRLRTWILCGMCVCGSGDDVRARMCVSVSTTLSIRLSSADGYHTKGQLLRCRTYNLISMFRVRLPRAIEIYYKKNTHTENRNGTNESREGERETNRNGKMREWCTGSIRILHINDCSL